MARLRRLDPATFRSQPLALPGDDVLVGRSPDCQLVLQGDSVRPRHCRLLRDRDLWRLEAFAPDVLLNGGHAAGTPLLQHGDLIQLGAEALVFEDRVEAVLPALEHAIAGAPEVEASWRVWADALLEREDPLGEHIARALAGAWAGDDHWLDGLWREVNHGLLELEWRHGVLRRAVIRSNGRLDARGWALTLTRLLALRVSRFLEELVIDLPGVRAGVEPLGPAELAAARALVLTGAVPATLRRLSLGYQLAAGTLPELSAEERGRFPRLEHTSQFAWPSSASLILERLSPHVRGVLAVGARIPLRSTLQASLKELLLFTSSVSPAATRDATATFGLTDRRCDVRAWRPEALSLNGRPVRYALLLPGDRVTLASVADATAQATLRFELD